MKVPVHCLFYFLKIIKKHLAMVAVPGMRIVVEILDILPGFEVYSQSMLECVTGRGIALSIIFHLPNHAPATVIPSIRIVGLATAPRNTRSFPIAVTLRSISERLPAIVTSSTACVNSPFSIQSPVAPRE